MFTLNDDNSIYATRGDIVFFSVSAEDDGKPYKFQAGDVVRIKVYGKKDAENVVLQKDFPVLSITEKVEIFLSEQDTKFGDVISKPKDYWYEVELNPYDNPQTIIGYDDDGPKVFRLYPEGDDLTEFVPDQEDIPVVDDELDLQSTRPVQNQAVARAFANLQDGYDRTNAAVAEINVTPEMFGAIGDGVSDDTKAIQQAINACSAFGILRFSNKTYCVSETIALNKKVNIVCSGTILKATQKMDCVLSLINQGSLRPYTISGLNVDANNLATDAIKIGGDNHATQITFRDCIARNALVHGFYVRPTAYIVNFVSCLAENNGADGLNCVAPDSSKQINAINIEKCSFQRNGTSGLHINGVSISVSECNSEFNKYGITVGGNDYVTYGAFITNCHLEYNTIASVYVDTKASATVSVVRCYLLQSNYSKADGATSFIKCSNASVDVSLIVDENTFQGNENLYFVDGGNKLGARSVIVVSNVGRLVNMKYAKIRTLDTSERYIPLPMTLASGVGFVDCNTSANFVGAAKKSIKMIVPCDLVNSLPRTIGVTVETDSTTKLRCLAKKYNINTKSVDQQTLYDVTVSKNGEVKLGDTIISNNGDVKCNLLNSWVYNRISNNTYLEVEFQLLDAGNASTFVLSNAYIGVYV